MMKIKFLICALLTAFILSGCNGNEDKDKAKDTEDKAAAEETAENEEGQTKENEDKENEDKENKDETNKDEEENAIDDRITHQGGGLGDTLSVYKEKYGENAGSEMLARFDNDYVLVTFIEKRAMNVTLQFEATNQPRRTREEALAIAEPLMPYDATKIDEYVADSGSEIIVYKSELLANIFEEDAFINAEKGTFITILKPSINDDGYFGVVLATGNNP